MLNKKLTLILVASAIVIGIFAVGFALGRKQPAETQVDRFLDRVKEVGEQAKKDAEKLRNEGKKLLEH